jgi:calcium-dependent protein kinase
MVEEYCSAGDLYDYIRQQKYFSEKKAANIMFQLLSAVNYLHKKSIVHRDLKPENIVFTKTNSVNYSTRGSSKNEKNEEIFIKLIDFGTSVHLTDGNLTQELGTIYYIAPEVFKNNYNEHADVWSCGIILYIMLCGHPPFCGKSEDDIKHKIIHSPLQFLPKDFNKVSTKAVEYVKQLLTYDARKRPSAEEALENEWLNEMIRPEGEEKVLQSGVLDNLAKFTSAVTLQKATLSFIANQMNMNEEIKKLKDSFDKIDVNKDGVVSRDELIQCLESVHSHEIAVMKAKEIFEEIDFNNDGTINFSEFLTVNLKKEKICNEDLLRKAFKLFDLDGNGYITIEELQETIPLDLQNNSQWVDIVKEVDQDGDCQISFEEFKTMMEKLSCFK